MGNHIWVQFSNTSCAPHALRRTELQGTDTLIGLFKTLIGSLWKNPWEGGPKMYGVIHLLGLESNSWPEATFLHLLEVLLGHLQPVRKGHQSFVKV